MTEFAGPDYVVLGILSRMAGLSPALKRTVNSIPLKLLDRTRLLTERLTAQIGARTEKLGHFSDRIRACHVTVDGPGQHPLKGRVRIRIRLLLPDSEIAINRQTGADLGTAIRESFDAADQRLGDYVRISRQTGAGPKRRIKRNLRPRG